MKLLGLFISFFFIAFSFSSCIDMGEMQADKTIRDKTLLLLQIKGLITSELSENFADHVRTYASKDKIKGVLIRVDSPGGAVAASQEINSAIADIKKLYKKPVYVSGGDLVASGGVFSIMNADKIFVNAGTLFGSIGVLAQFRNLSELAKWAKVEFYNITAGEFKDSGDPFRKMTFRERELFENLLEVTHNQFKQSIIAGRNLDPKDVELFSDGRVFSGADAVQYGLADEVGTFNDTLRALGSKTGLGSDPKLFDPDFKTPYERFFENFGVKSNPFSVLLSRWNQLESLSGKPLYILPGYLAN